MNETNMIKTEDIKKPYTFRKLESKDVFLMFKIISAIGVNNFTKCMESESVLKAIKSLSADEKKSDSGTMIAASAMILEIANVIFEET